MASGYRTSVISGTVLLMASALSAQTSKTADPDSAAASITSAVVRQTVDALTRDSMEGRRLGTAGLDRAAAYVSAEFRRLGLTSEVLPFQLPGKKVPQFDVSGIDFAVRLGPRERSFVDEVGGSVDYYSVGASFNTVARFAVDTIREAGCAEPWSQPTQPQMTVLAGRQTAATARAATGAGSTVFYVPPLGTDSAGRADVIRALVANYTVIVVSDEDDETFARRHAEQRARPPVVINNFMERMSPTRRCAAFVAADAPGLDRLFAIAGVDLATLRADTVPTVRALPAVGAHIRVNAAQQYGDTASGVNVVALLPGSDTLAMYQHMIFVAHLDQATAAPGRGANDNASSVAALLALARAFAQWGPALKRPLMFVATTATTPAAAGANSFIQAKEVSYSVGGYPVFVLDMLGGGPADSVFADGLADLELPAPPAWIALQHPELGLTLADGGTVANDRSDNAAFVALGLPTLLFHGGTHAAVAASSADADRVDADLTARRTRLVYYIARDLLAAPKMPRWTAAGRQHRLDFLGR